MKRSHLGQLYGWTNRLFMLGALAAFATLATARLQTLEPGGMSPDAVSAPAATPDLVAAILPSRMPLAASEGRKLVETATVCTLASPEEGPWIVLDVDLVTRYENVADAEPSVAAALEDIVDSRVPDARDSDRMGPLSSITPLAVMLADGRLVAPGEILSDDLRVKAISRDSVLLERDGEIGGIARP